MRGTWREQMARLQGRLDGANEVLRLWTIAMEAALEEEPASTSEGEDGRGLLIGAMVSARDRTAGLLDELAIELELLSQTRPADD